MGEQSEVLAGITGQWPAQEVCRGPGAEAPDIHHPLLSREPVGHRPPTCCLLLGLEVTQDTGKGSSTSTEGSRQKQVLSL